MKGRDAGGERSRFIPVFLRSLTETLKRLEKNPHNTHTPCPRFLSFQWRNLGLGPLSRNSGILRKALKKRRFIPVPRALILVMGSLKDGKRTSCNRKSFAEPSTHREKGLPQQRSNIHKRQVGGERTTKAGVGVGCWGQGGRMVCKR